LEKASLFKLYSKEKNKSQSNQLLNFHLFKALNTIAGANRMMMRPLHHLATSEYDISTPLAYVGFISQWVCWVLIGGYERLQRVRELRFESIG